MVDENITIRVTESGTDDVTAKLTALGTAGDAAAQKAAAGMKAASSATDSFYSSLTAAIASMNSGATATAQLGTAANQTASQVNNAATSVRSATSATQAQTSAMNAATAGVTAHTQSVGNMTNSYKALNEVLKLSALLFGANTFKNAIDGATQIDNILKRLTATTGDYDDIYKRLLATSNASGQSFEVTVKAFQSLRVATEGAGISNQKLAVALDTIDKALQLSGTSAEHQSRVMRDIVEAAAQGTLTSRQLVTILAQAPGVMEAITGASHQTVQALLAQSSAHTATAKSVKLANTEMTVSTQDRVRNETAALKKASENELKVALDTTSSAAQIAAAHQKVIASHQRLVDTNNVSSAQINANMAKNQAAMDKADQSLSHFIDDLVGANGPISQATSQFTLTISQSFTVLNNDLIDYFTNANKATGVNKLLSESIVAIGAALPALIPIVLAFGAAWLTIQAVSIIQSIIAGLTELGVFIVTTMIPTITALGVDFIVALGPVPLLIAAIIAGVVVLATQLHLIKNPLEDIKNMFASVKAEAASSFAQVFTDAQKAATGIDTATGAANGLSGALNGAAQAANNLNAAVAGGPIISGATSATIGGLDSHFADFGGSGYQGPSLSSGATPVEQLSSSVGSFAVGGAFHVPGAGTPDSRLVQFMATPGERVVVQTPAQQKSGEIPHFASGGMIKIPHQSVAHHRLASPKKLMHTVHIPSHAFLPSVSGLPHFATGGIINVGNFQVGSGVTLGLTGINVKFVASDTQSLVGYNAPTTVTPASAAAGAAGAAASVASGAAKTTTTFTTPSSADPLTGGGLTAGELASLQQYESIYGIDPFAGTNTQRAQQLAILKRLGGPDIGYDWSNNKHPVPVWSMVKALNADGTVIYNNGPIFWPEPPQAGITVGGKSGRTAGTDQAIGSYFGPLQKARDGIDFTVPGTGAVDSRVLTMAVSPGEQVSVKTPAQQEAEAGGAGGARTIIQNITIQASDIDSYARSKKQILRDLASSVNKAV